jgi:type I restriction enzyme R subunit
VSGVQSEAHLEAALVERLAARGWAPVRLPDETALWANLRAELGAHNGVAFSDAEFARVRNHLGNGNPFQKARTLRDRLHLTRDDGSSLYVGFFNSEHWCRNRYQIATQIGIEGRRRNRYDVTLLVNGLPLGQIELKRRGVELKKAFDQINRYQRDSFRAAGGLFQFIQIFVISNGVNTRYYANNRRQTFRQTFTWADRDNLPINRLEAFADAFLEKCHLSKMIARYVVSHESDRILMILRPYQYHAAEAITERVMKGRTNGYVWHTTGSGKTLTSFKAAQNLLAIPEVGKVVFVVDRADLDYQTTREFNHFAPGSVDGTDNTRALVAQMTARDTRLVITTIQKLNAAISRERFAPAMEAVRDERVVFIFDECHRSQFGDAHRRIREFFPRAQMFGFTGTPIFADNAIGMRTTKDLFDECLHRYVITDAIRDDNVLRFSVEYLAPARPEAGASGDAAADRRRQAARDRAISSPGFYDRPDRIGKVVDWIVANHDRKTRNRQFGAMMAVSSVDALIDYYETFEAKRQDGAHDLKVATIFTYAADEDDPEADGLIPDTRFPDGQPSPAQLPKRDRLAAFVADYNARYGANESVRDGAGFYGYYKALAKRVKDRDRSPFDPAQGVDILLVVNMFLTGFDAKTLNTLYVDKNLRYHGLIQAFSRTNRILGQEKSHGNIVCFRDLKERTDEAIALFADRNARETILIPPCEEQLARFEAAVVTLRAVVPTPDDVDALPDEDAQAAFVRAFRDVMRIRNVLASFSEFDPGALPLTPQAFEDYKSKYLDLAQRGGDDGGGGDDPGSSPLSEIDFELELIRQDEINVAYILALLITLTMETRAGGAGAARADEQRRRIFELLVSEVQLRNKRDAIERFIDQRLPMLGPDDDIRAAFARFWSDERDRACADLCAQENLDPPGVERLIRTIVFTGKRPMADAIVAAMNTKPGILQRRAAIERVVSGIEAVIATYDEGIGDLED